MIDRNDLSLKIPAFLRGDTSAEDTAKIEALAARDADFAADIGFQKALGQSLKEADAPDSSLEFGWARLSRAIDAQDAPLAQIRPEGQAQEPANDRTPSRLWQYAAGLLACVVIAQSLFNGPGSQPDDQYVMAGQSDAGYGMVVTLDDTAATKALTSFLHSHGGVVTTGPNALGQYHILFADREACEIASAQLSQGNGLFETYSACSDG